METLSVFKSLIMYGMPKLQVQQILRENSFISLPLGSLHGERKFRYVIISLIEGKLMKHLVHAVFAVVALLCIIEK